MEYFAYSQKEFIYKYVVMTSDTDQFRHMSFANYLKLMYLASDAFLVTALTPGFVNYIKLTNVDSRMQFKRAATIGENILIKINACDISTKNFVLLFTYLREESADLIALGRQSYVEESFTDDKLNIKEKLETALRQIAVDERNILYKY